MSDQEYIESVAKVSRSKGKEIALSDEPEIRIAPDKEKFDATLDASNNTNAITNSNNNQNSETNLMEQIRALNRKVETVSEVDPQVLANESRNVITQIEELRSRLSDPNVEIKNDYKRVLNNKLENVDSNLKIALEKAGLEYIPPDLLIENDITPVGKFLTLLTNGQENLKSLGSELQTYAGSEKQLNPANLMMIQIKVNYVQQEIEFFSSLLNKALESTKTIMNVQV